MKYSVIPILLFLVLGNLHGAPPVKLKVRPERVKTETRIETVIEAKYLEVGVFEGGRSRKLPYRLFRPEESEGKLPLVIFLHGLGESGSDNLRQLKHAEPLVFAQPEMQKKYPCYVLAPQHLAGGHWGTVSLTNPSNPLKTLNELVTSLAKSERIDEKRIYIMGLSSGGWGAFDAVTMFPEIYAAAVVISSAPPVALLKKRKQARPVWFAFNSGDGELEVRTEELGKTLSDMGHATVLNIATGRGGHEAWTWVFHQSRLHRWLFEQKLME